ncbi:putative disease resistance protein RGA4 [Quercus lobata]|uniref:putative disease resistance protein RGA4 n=1 Tax=Quercus lobata TaxID=97700 RepID=UPI001244E756|nr:putative disease resistance protein RGA4 [Quercus lobata]
MADAILYGVVQTIIESLGSSTLQPIGSIWGVKDDLEKMKNTVLAIQAVLQDAEEQQVENHQVKHWLMNLRDAVYDADDLLSEFTTHVLQQKVMDGDKIVKKVRIFFSSSNPVVFGFEMARKLKAMRERFNDISNDRDQFQLKLVGCPLETRVLTRGRDQTHSFVTDEEVIGREKDKQAIIDLLLDFDVEDNVSFISIVGIGGLGKTTLAQYVFNDEKVQTQFELKIWVCVSDVFDIKTIVEMIIGSATGEKPENLVMDPLQNELRRTLNQKKYLLILDDVWNEDSENWCNLKRLLMGGAKGSKVVITTRTNMVAEITSTISPYFLKGLSRDQSWSLLKKMAFKKGQETINSNLEAIGMDIVEKCQGVPLAIRTIGKVLFFKKTEDEWLYIKNTKLTDVTQLKDGIMPVLKLSYDYLPSHLKCCFAYCSLFPKDYLIDKLTLIQLWISQGFIQSSEESHEVEHVANEYFMELLWRSFFQEAKEHGGMNRWFKMHDLIHDLAQYISKIDCILVDSNAKNVKEKGHHLSFPFYNVSFFEENLSTLVKANKLRTFILAYNK